MNKQIEVSAKTLEDAIDLACGRLGKTRDQLQIETLEEAKKGFFGVGSSEARILVTYQVTPCELAKEFVETFLKNIGMEAVQVQAEYDQEKDEIALVLDGDNLGLLIGHHGDVLDALQYLTGLAANRGKSGFTRVTVDIENYRQKRVDTLKQLARRSAAKVKKNGRNLTFEPMNPYERRIIHSEVQNISGVTTYSIGNGDDRRVVISPEGGPKKAPRTERERKPSTTAPKSTYIYNPERPPRQIVKAKSIDDIPLADVEDTEIVTFD